MDMHLGVLADGRLVEIYQQSEFDEILNRWVYFDTLIDGTRIENQTFLPFIWGFLNWDQALAAFHSGQISNINDMKKTWSVA